MPGQSTLRLTVAERDAVIRFLAHYMEATDQALLAGSVGLSLDPTTRSAGLFVHWLEVGKALAYLMDCAQKHATREDGDNE